MFGEKKNWQGRGKTRNRNWFDFLEREARKPRGGVLLPSRCNYRIIMKRLLV